MMNEDDDYTLLGCARRLIKEGNEAVLKVLNHKKMTGKLKHWVAKENLTITKGRTYRATHASGDFPYEKYPDLFEPVYELTSNKVEFPDSLPPVYYHHGLLSVKDCNGSVIITQHLTSLPFHHFSENGYEYHSIKDHNGAVWTVGEDTSRGIIEEIQWHGGGWMYRFGSTWIASDVNNKKDYSPWQNKDQEFKIKCLFDRLGSVERSLSHIKKNAMFRP